MTDSLSNATGEGLFGEIGISIGRGDELEDVEEMLGDGEDAGAVLAAGKINAISPLGRRVGTS